MTFGETLRQWLGSPLVTKLAMVALGLVVVALLRRVLDRALARRIEDRDARYGAQKFLAAASYVAGALVVAAVFSDQLGGFTVALGVAGAGIAFALQEVIASVAGWLAVSFGGFFKVGDRVQLGGIKGDVIDIGVLRTTLMECGEWMQGDIYTGRVVRVANSFVFKEPVFNYSGDFPFLWDEIRVPVQYGCDRPLARALFERVAAEVAGPFAHEVAGAWREITTRFRIEDVPLAPAVTMTANDNWMEFTLRYPVHYRARRTTRDRLFSRILDEIDASGGRVKLASATFELVGAPPLDVRLRPAEPPA